MERFPDSIGEEILIMEKNDLGLTEALRVSGELSQYGYHPSLEQLHLANSTRLQTIVEKEGFPTLKNSSESVHTAAWRIVQHAISNPAFMRFCYEWFIQYPDDEIPLKTKAYLGDRIAFYERRPQHYGTQFDYGLNGKMDVWWLENESMTDSWRAQAGLPTLNEAKKAYKNVLPVSGEEAKRMRAQQEEWLIKVGWCSEKEIWQCHLHYGN